MVWSKQDESEYQEYLKKTTDGCKGYLHPPNCKECFHSNERLDRLNLNDCISLKNIKSKKKELLKQKRDSK
jgi:hypothetical protein